MTLHPIIFSTSLVLISLLSGVQTSKRPGSESFQHTLPDLTNNQADAPQRTYKWSGAWMPMRISAGDGVTALDDKIGRFQHFPETQSYWNAINKINSKFPGSAPWATWTVGDLSRAIPAGSNPTDAQHEAFLTLMDQHGVAVFLEIFPYAADPKNGLPAVDPSAEIDKWLSKFKHHKSVSGVGIELEYFGKATDILTKAWYQKIKKYNKSYRLFLRHYNKDFMPPTFRGSGDLIFMCDASESTIEQLNEGFANWANHFSPTACAFQIGYPADEDGMNGSKDLGWWRLKDPVQEWGDGILPLITNDKQEIGLIWVTARSGKSYNQQWDLTR